MRLNPVLEQLGSYPIAVVHERARAMRAAGKTVIDFSIGDPREPTPPFIPGALKAAVPAVSQYPTTAGLDELRAAIAAYLGRRFGVGVRGGDLPRFSGRRLVGAAGRRQTGRAADHR